MSSPIKIVQTLLINLGLGSVVGASQDWPIYVAFLPDEYDEVISVNSTSGFKDGRIMATGEQIIHPGIQIRVRGNPLDYDTPYQKIKAIQLALDIQRRVSVAISSDEVYIVHNASLQSDILYLGVDGEGSRARHSFTINYVVTISSE